MFFIPGFVITLLTFPGVIVHELAHQLFCRWFKVPVFEVCYFRTGNPAGYVLHEKTKRPVHAIFISIGPFIVNTLLGFLIALPAAMQYKFDAATPFDYLLIYLGVSIAMHAFPSTGDASAMWREVMDNPETGMLTKLMVAPVAGLIYVGALGSFFWLDLLYGMGVALGLPWLIIQAFA